MCNSSGSSCADRSVERTRSQEITVICRCSALWTVDPTVVGRSNAARAWSSRLRWPNDRPNFSNSASLRPNNTSKSMSLEAKARAYWAKPNASSHSLISTMLLRLRRWSSVALRRLSVFKMARSGVDACDVCHSEATLSSMKMVSKSCFLNTRSFSIRGASSEVTDVACQ